MFEIVVEPDAALELEELPPFESRRILDEIERQLGMAPTRETRRRKRLVGVDPPWDQVGPVWRLRVGEFRVFYDVIPARRLLLVKAIRAKGRRTTGEIL